MPRTFNASCIKPRTNAKGAYIVLHFPKKMGDVLSVPLPDKDRRRIILDLLRDMPEKLRVRLAEDLLYEIDPAELVTTAKMVLGRIDSDKRREVMDDFCSSCGSRAVNGCNCWNDE